MYGTVFPCFRLGASDLQFVSHFKYLGHIITHNLSDDNDIQREVRSMFFRCNVLIHKFSNCSLRVKVKLCQSYCLCFYDTALRFSYHASSMCKFRSCYNKCLKLLFGYKNMTVPLRLYLKLDSRALTLCVQMLVLTFALDGHTVITPWSLCCMHVRLINCLSCIFKAFLGLGFIYVYLL